MSDNKITLQKAVGHFLTITNHKRLVMEGCFKAGLYYQGIMHDLSKYSCTEFIVGARYFQGDRSPNNAEREDKGLSTAWLHHKGRNKHHLEYWIDYNMDWDGVGIPLKGMKMPVKYVVEMFIDRVSACKNYQKDKYTDASPLKYYMKGKAPYMLHPESKELLERLLKILAKHGEDYTYAYIRRKVLKNDRVSRSRRFHEVVDGLPFIRLMGLFT